jgi:hypothetical protein
MKKSEIEKMIRRLEIVKMDYIKDSNQKLIDEVITFLKSLITTIGED